MPLKSGSSNQVKSANISELRSSGYPERQAIAIAESKARDADSPMQKGYNDGKSGLRDKPPKKKADADEYMKGYLVGAHERRNDVANRGRDCNIEMDDADIEADGCEAPAALDSARRMVFDRRMETIDGHLVVTDCNISKANVCPYLGSEIPGSEALGLDPSKIYMLYRDAAELQAAVKTYDRVPLLMQHVAVSADQPQQFLTVGTVSNARFSHPYLKADLTVWTREGIDAIESGKQRELSCGYRYTPEMTPGTSPEGEKYDGRMTQIVANHIALVEAGRAGPDVMVADAALIQHVN